MDTEQENPSRYRKTLALLRACLRPEAIRTYWKASKITVEESEEESLQNIAESIAAELKTCGPAYVKIGQFLSTQTNFLPDVFTEAFSSLQDDIPSCDFSEIEAVIRAEFEPLVANSLLERMETEPIASASLGQVHRAVLEGERVVAVKIQRPGVSEELSSDLRAWRRILITLETLMRREQEESLSIHLKRFEKRLLEELDYRVEAQNLLRLSDIFEDFPDIEVPLPDLSRTSARVLTMDYVAGKRLSELTNQERGSVRIKTLADQLFRAFLKQILIEGFVHLDPHPGNVLINTNGNATLIDAGMAGTTSSVSRRGLLKLLISIFEKRAGDVANSIISISNQNSKFSRKRFHLEVASILSESELSSASEISTGAIILSLSRAAKSTGLELHPDITMIGQTLMKLERVGEMMAPNYNPADTIRGYKNKLIREYALTEFESLALGVKLLDFTQAAQNLPMHLNYLAERAANNELKINVDAIDERELIRGFQKIANRITSGLVVAAMIIGSALMMRVESTWTIFGYPALAISLLIAAGLVGAYLTVSILIKDRR